MYRLPTLIVWSICVTVCAVPGGVGCWSQTAHDAAPEVTVDHVWSRAAPAGRSTAVFLTITAAGGSDRLSHVAAAIAGGAEIHQSEAQNGVMRMHAVDAVPVAPGTPLKFAPGGYHIMLTSLHHPLAVGDTFPITLTFEHAGAITVTATVAKAGAAAAPHDDMPGMDMSGHKMP